MDNSKPENINSGAEYVLQLFVTGASSNSVRAITNVKNICEAHIKGRYSLEVTDVYQQHAVAQAEQLIALPMLVRLYPLPKRRMVGDMSDTARVLNGLGITPIR